MSNGVPTIPSTDGPPAGYEAAMAELEDRAARGELTIAEVKREIFALRERFAASPDRVTGWAAQAHAQSSSLDAEPGPGCSIESAGGHGGEQSTAEDVESKLSGKPA